MKKLVIIAALMLSFVINCSQKNSEPETPTCPYRITGTGTVRLRT